MDGMASLIMNKQKIINQFVNYFYTDYRFRAILGRIRSIYEKYYSECSDEEISDYRENVSVIRNEYFNFIKNNEIISFLKGIDNRELTSYGNAYFYKAGQLVRKEY